MKNNTTTVKQSSQNYLAMMRKAIVYPSKRRENRHGWRSIPAICSMNVIVGPVNEYLREIGIKKKSGTKLEFEETSQAKMNRYVMHQVRRMDRARLAKNSHLYWKIAMYSLRYSKSFRIAAYNKVFNGWWHSMDVKRVFLILKRADVIIKGLLDDLKYRRAYVPKGNTVRPLGIPTSEWRLVMHMMNNYITMWVRSEIDLWNHGFLPQRGTNTCIMKAIRMLNEEKYVYEFDLKQFFPSVRVSKVTDFLEERKVPTEICRWMDQINRASPELPEELLLEEKSTFRWNLESEMKKDEIDWNNPAYEQLKFIPWEDMMREDGYTDVRLWMKDQLGLLDQYREAKKDSTSLKIDKNSNLGGLDTPCVGLPQGLNTSPILSLTILVEWVAKLEAMGLKVLMYADDGFIYSNKKFEPFAPEGIPFNVEKSGWVKYPGFIRPVKFLGVIIDTEKQELEGRTRNGSTLKFGTQGSELLALLRYLVTAYNDEASDWKEDPDLTLLSKSGIFGFTISRLYQNSWGEKEWEDQEWKHNVYSWLGYNAKCKQDPTKSSEAIPFLHLLVSKSMNKNWVPSRHFRKNSRDVFQAWKTQLLRKLAKLNNQIIEKRLEDVNIPISPEILAERSRIYKELNLEKPAVRKMALPGRKYRWYEAPSQLWSVGQA